MWWSPPQPHYVTLFRTIFLLKFNQSSLTQASTFNAFSFAFSFSRLTPFYLLQNLFLVETKGAEDDWSKAFIVVWYYGQPLWYIPKPTNSKIKGENQLRWEVDPRHLTASLNLAPTNFCLFWSGKKGSCRSWFDRIERIFIQPSEILYYFLERLIFFNILFCKYNFTISFIYVKVKNKFLLLLSFESR